jgi:signal recognition particle subunit SRP54
MFESLSARLDGIFSHLRGRGKLTEANIKEATREIRLALLEADVNFQVVKDFVQRVREQALGQEVMRSLTPGQQVVKIVRDELTTLMGSQHVPLTMASQPPTTFLLIGLQGSGKTTSAAKLARKLQDMGRRPLLVAADVYRPAAMEQLRLLGEQIQTPVVVRQGSRDPVDICRQAFDEAPQHQADAIVIDTAGRLQIDETLMQELADIKTATNPRYTFLVVDAMTGQEAVNVATAFNEAVSIEGVILTKLDGDARGGAALSIQAVVGKPIQFVGVGEKLDALEAFHPERMASRLLGMGDVLTLIERAEQAIDPESVADLEAKMRQASFSLEDFQNQLRQVKQMGPLENLMELIPGLKGAKLPVAGEKDLKKVEAIIGSMTLIERRNPALINGNRRKRIALGSGTRVEDVNRLLKQFGQMRKLMKSMMTGKGKSRRKWAGMPMVRPF